MTTALPTTTSSSQLPSVFTVAISSTVTTVTWNPSTTFSSSVTPNVTTVFATTTGSTAGSSSTTSPGGSTISDLTLGEKIGIGIGGAFVAILVMLGLYLAMKRKKPSAAPSSALPTEKGTTLGVSTSSANTGEQHSASEKKPLSGAESDSSPDDAG